MTHQEIERKFLIAGLPEDIDRYPHHVIRQGYITTDSENEVRIRSKGEKYYLTIKQGRGLSRTEVEIIITEDQFESLWVLTENKRIEKTRYDLDSHAYLIEVDVYQNKLSPLQVAEVEFPTIEASQEFMLPEFFGREVTNDKAYKNASLACDGIPDSYFEP